MIKTNLLIPLILVISFALVSCYTQVAKEDNQKPVGSWEVLTESSITSTVPIGVNIVFFDENNGISWDINQIKQTSDGGKSWNLIYNFDQSSVYSLIFAKDNIGWAVGSDKGNKPFVINSKDKGLSWQQVSIETKDSENQNKRFSVFYDICFSSPEKGWVVGDAGLLEVSFDGQNMKVINQFFPEEELHRVSCNNSGEGGG